MKLLIDRTEGKSCTDGTIASATRGPDKMNKKELVYYFVPCALAEMVVCE